MCNSLHFSFYFVLQFAMIPIRSCIFTSRTNPCSFPFHRWPWASNESSPSELRHFAFAQVIRIISNSLTQHINPKRKKRMRSENKTTCSKVNIYSKSKSKKVMLIWIWRLLSQNIFVASVYEYANRCSKYAYLHRSLDHTFLFIPPFDKSMINKRFCSIQYGFMNGHELHIQISDSLSVIRQSTQLPNQASSRTNQAKHWCQYYHIYSSISMPYPWPISGDW